ncbi:putative GAF domain-containing protein [Candidatus Magnetomoraceae bacterium gMMP-15]
MANRHDSPLRMILAYQEQTASLMELMDELAEEQSYDLKKIFEIIWPHLKLIVTDIAGGAIIGLREDQQNNQIKIHAMQNIFKNIKEWDELNDKAKEIISSAMIEEESKNVKFWNREEYAPQFATGSKQNQAVSLSWLCDHPDDEKLFLILVRDVKKRPFLSHEIQAIKMTSRIIGWLDNYLFTNELLIFGIHSSIKNS